MKDLEKQAEDFIKDYPSYVIQKQFDLEDPVIYKLLSDFANEVSKALLEEAAEKMEEEITVLVQEKEVLINTNPDSETQRDYIISKISKLNSRGSELVKAQGIILSLIPKDS